MRGPGIRRSLFRGVTATDCSLTIPENMREADWVQLGHAIAHEHDKATWWLGDWWVFGERRRYGERKAIADAWDGPDYQTCRNAGWVARAFEPSRRRDNLKFGHHEVVAALPPDDQDRLLDFAEELIAGGGQRRTIRELRAERDAFLEQKARALAARQTSTPADVVASMRTSKEVEVREATIYSVGADPEGNRTLRLVPPPTPSHRDINTAVATIARLLDAARAARLPETAEAQEALGVLRQALGMRDSRP
jgi:hypothetical protein